MDAAVEQQPLVKAAQATELARRRARLDAVLAQMFEERRHVLLRRRQQHAVPALDELGEGVQVAEIGLAGEWSQSFLHAQIGLVVLQKREIVLGLHTFDYPRPASCAAGWGLRLPNHVHQGIKCGNNMELEIISGKIVHLHDACFFLYGWARSALILFSIAGRSASP